jgi:hypothetical protein
MYMCLDGQPDYAGCLSIEMRMYLSPFECFELVTDCGAVSLHSLCMIQLSRSRTWY